MKLVIDIPEEKYNYVKKQVAEGIDNPLKMYIANGASLNEVFDKIRAEIIQMPTISSNANDIYKADVLEIIDKYKESEDKEGE